MVAKRQSPTYFLHFWLLPLLNQHLPSISHLPPVFLFRGPFACISLDLFMKDASVRSRSLDRASVDVNSFFLDGEMSSTRERCAESQRTWWLEILVAECLSWTQTSNRYLQSTVLGAPLLTLGAYRNASEGGISAVSTLICK